MNSRTYLLFLMITLVGLSEARAAGNAVTGESLYKTKCAACHTAQYNGVGPAHAGVFGRKAGTYQGYTYSDALAKSSIVWNEKLLDAWLRNPEKLVPGQKMGISVASARERADLIAYLKTLNATPTQSP